MKDTCFILLALIFSLNLVQAETTNWKQNRIIPLEKITVGPWDNFSSSIGVDDTTLYFTRNSNQISNIFRQDLKTALVQRYVGEQGDAKQATLNEGAGRLAITYFKNDAQGDICLVRLSDKQLQCITSEDTVDQTPFWIDSSTLGYIRRYTGKLEWQLVEYHISTKQEKILASGQLTAPGASPDGRTILFNQLIDGEPVVHAYDRQTQSLKPLTHFDLPGISGFFRFSVDGKYVYFNQYLNDTNGDQQIDGSDNSVVFRVPTATWLSATDAVFPEQLTSVDTNCKFPSLSRRYLYVTCAFEGSLDIYRLPLTGVIPADWSEAQIREAHTTARHYEQRLLLLNSLRYRFNVRGTAMLEKLLSNHLEIGELTAARYYIDQIIRNYRHDGNQHLVKFYASLSELLYVRSSKQRVPVDIVTTHFQKIVATARKKLGSLTLDNKNLQALVDAYLAYELEDDEASLETLQRIKFDSDLLPLERYLVFELYKKLLLAKAPETLLGLYPRMFNEAELTSDARLYYAFSYLKLLQKLDFSITQRLKRVKTQLQSSDFPGIKALFQSEAASLMIAGADDKKIQRQQFKQLKMLLKKNTQDLLLRKAMHTRAIQNLGQANRFTYMALLSRHWLTVTHITEMEFVNVAEQYSAITTNKAYGMMAKGELAKAYAVFYSAIRQTNDLEAHFQFISLGLTAGLNKKENMSKSYELLREQKLLGENQPYVDALRLIIQARTDEKPNTAIYDKALAMLEKMPTSGLNPAMRDLLMGYLYHQKLRLSQTGYAYDKTFFQRAHYHYMMALDLAQDNVRISATVWQNLGWLQFEVRQYAQAASFFQHRLALPFVQKMDEVSVRWMLARSLFYNNQKSEALDQAEANLALVIDNRLGDPTPFREKAAFYAMQAEDYAKAKQFYGYLLKNKLLTSENQVKSTLAYAYVLMRLKMTSQAVDQFEKVAELSNSLEVLKKNNRRLLAAYPQRFQLLAYGFLSQLSADNKKKINYLQQRIDLFKKMAGSASEYAYDEAGRLSFLIKDLQHLAVANEQLNQPRAMAKSIHQALVEAEKWMDETGDEVGPVIYRTLVNYLTLNISHPAAFSANDTGDLERIIKRVFQAFKNHPYRSSYIVYQHNKLKILWMMLESYRDNTINLKKRFADLLHEEEIEQLQTDSPESYNELRTLILFNSPQSLDKIIR
ncbi:MAG TPA: hypothetical protein ENK06_05170 [Gammaproteobacteria bacterium]|nr:hypothetical protein [Gammaproteobacteria bacterium]